MFTIFQCPKFRIGATHGIKIFRLCGGLVGRVDCSRDHADGKTRVSKVIETVSKNAGAPIKIAGFVRFGLGEGIDRPPADFAGEVGAQLNS